MNAFGGLLVGSVIKYADAILKDIAIGASILVSSTASIYLFNFSPSWPFAAAVLCVSYAVPLYAGRVDCAGFCADTPAPRHGGIV